MIKYIVACGFEELNYFLISFFSETPFGNSSYTVAALLLVVKLLLLNFFAVGANFCENYENFIANCL